MSSDAKPTYVELEARLAKSEAELAAVRRQQPECLDVARAAAVERACYAEEALRSKEAELRAVTEITPVMLTRCSRDLRYLYINHAYAAMLGSTPDQIIGKPILEIMGAQGFATIRPHVEQVLRGQPVEYEDEVHFAVTGQSHWLHMIYMPDRDERGQVVGWVASITDNTARKAAEEALGESEDRYRGVVENTTAIILRVAPNGVITFANQRALELFGYSAEELIGKHAVGTVLPPRESSGRDLATMVDEIAADPDAFRTNANENMCKDGRTVWLEWTNSGIYGPDGKLKEFLSVGIDVTARKQAEEALAAAHREIQSVIDNTPAIVYAFDLEERFVLANATVADLLNSTPEQMIGKRRCEFMPQEDADWHEANDHRVIEAGRAMEFEEYSKLQGRSITWLTTKFPLRDSQGRIYAVAGISAEITQRKRMEEALRELNATLEKRVAERTAEVVQANAYNRNLIEASLDPLVTIGPDGKITDVNAATEAATGLTREQLVGTDFCDYFTDPAKARAGYEQVFRDGAVRDYGLELRHCDGRVMSVVYHASVYCDEQGKVAGVFAAARDITDRLRSEVAIKAERQRLFDVLEALPAMVCLLTPDYHVSFANRGFRERFGESNGRRCYEFCFGQDEPCNFCQAYKVLETGQPHHWELPAPDGSVIDTYDFPFTDVDGSPMILEMDLDITEIRKAQMALRQANEQLAGRAAQLRALAGELTLSEQRERRRMARLLHDQLQQLLVGCKFRLAVLGRHEDSVVQLATGEAIGLLDEAVRASRSLTAELSPPILHEAGLVEGLQWLARWMAEKHGLFVDLSMAKGPLPLTEDVKVLLFESGRELLFNVVKHAQAKSATLTLRPIKGRQIQLTVADEGVGFEADKVRPGTDGGGFGLFSIRERLELVGGQMEVRSTPGQGSVLVLTAPMRQPPATRAAPLAAEEPSGHGQAVEAVPPLPGAKVRVLLADDHAVTRQGLTQLLGQEPDMEVIGGAADGLEAVQLASELSPHVILMDLNMPNLNGVDATQAIHNDYPNIRIIGLSMFEEADRAQAMRDAGAVDYLTKTSPVEQLIAAIRRACQPAKTTKRFHGKRPRKPRR